MKEIIEFESGDDSIFGKVTEYKTPEPEPEDGEFSEDVEVILRRGDILTLKINSKERKFFVNGEVIAYPIESCSLEERDAIVTEILYTRQGAYGQEFEFGSKFKYFVGWENLKYVRFIKEIKE